MLRAWHWTRSGRQGIADTITISTQIQSLVGGIDQQATNHMAQITHCTLKRTQLLRLPRDARRRAGSSHEKAHAVTGAYIGQELGFLDCKKRSRRLIVNTTQWLLLCIAICTGTDVRSQNRLRQPVKRFRQQRTGPAVPWWQHAHPVAPRRPLDHKQLACLTPATQ